MFIENHKSESNVSRLLLMKVIFLLESFVSSLELPILYYLKHKIFLLTKLLLFEFSILVWRPSSFRSSENLLRKLQRRPIYHSLLTLNGQFLADLNKIGQYWWWLHCSNILFDDISSLNQNVLTRWQTPPTPAYRYPLSSCTRSFTSDQGWLCLHAEIGLNIHDVDVIKSFDLWTLTTWL